MGRLSKNKAGAGPVRAERKPNDRSELLDLEVPARSEYLAQARHAVAQLALQLHLTTEATCDLLLAVGEACNNAIQHGSEASRGPMRVRCSIDSEGIASGGRALRIDVANCGNGFTPGGDTLFPMPEADELAGHGRGLPLMQQLMDDVQVRCENGNTVVRLTKKIS